MKVLNYTGLTYLVNKLKFILVKKDLVDAYYANNWKLLYENMPIGASLPENSFYKIMAYTYGEYIGNSGFYVNGAYLVDEITIPSYILSTLPTKRIFFGSNGFLNRTFYLDFDDSLSLTTKSIYPIGLTFYPIIKVYTRAINQLAK